MEISVTLKHPPLKRWLVKQSSETIPHLGSHSHLLRTLNLRKISSFEALSENTPIEDDVLDQPQKHAKNANSISTHVLAVVTNSPVKMNEYLMLELPKALQPSSNQNTWQSYKSVNPFIIFYLKLNVLKKMDSCTISLSFDCGFLFVEKICVSRGLGLVCDEDSHVTLLGY